MTITDQASETMAVTHHGVIPLDVIEKVKPLAVRDTQDLTVGPRHQPNGFRAVIHEYLPMVDAIESALRRNGYRPQQLKFVSVFTQSPLGVRRYWHVDAREDAETDDILALCYLQDTSETNGALIVGPRTPRFLQAADDYEVGDIPGEVLVPSKLGDLIIIKPQQPHCAARNSTTEVRLLIRVWISLTKN